MTKLFAAPDIADPDDTGLDEIKRMEYLMSKAPCLKRMNARNCRPDFEAITDWNEKTEGDVSA